MLLTADGHSRLLILASVSRSCSHIEGRAGSGDPRSRWNHDPTFDGSVLRHQLNCSRPAGPLG